MSKAATHSTQPEPVDFKQIKQRFFAINRARLLRARADLRQRQLEFVELLPMLFHINHPLLPGYVSKQTPAGIPDYSPSADALRLAKRNAKSFSYKKRAYRKFDIHALYLMGSTGTIAYSQKSDFDVWVCYDPRLDVEQLEALQQKVRLIEQWAHSLEVDAHLFLVNPENFKRGQHGRLSSESSGSALHYLLLEEFYRTGLLLAGRYPLWWLVPPGEEANYDAYVADIKRKRYIHSRDHIDFGGLNNIQAEEFYGATLWLLYKGISSPYKSVLKILLMEAYANEYPAIDLLGTRFKRAIYQGENEINKLDPYLMMLHKVEEYLQRANQGERLELIRRSFYFKVNEPLSEDKAHGSTNWRRQLLGELANAWGWNYSRLFMLDSREQWKMQRVLQERQALIQELTHSYRFLSSFARDNAANMNLIKASDLNVLGRKLYAAFERKAGKIEIVYQGITQSLYESHLSIHRLSADGREWWVAFSGVVNEKEVAQGRPLKRAYSLIELLAWCFFNKTITATTVTALYTYGSSLSDKEYQFIVETFERVFSDQQLIETTVQDLRQPARIANIGSFINVGVDPFEAHTRRGTHLTSNRTDSLRFGGRLENLIQTVDQVIITSWQEVLTYRYSGVTGLFQCLKDYIQWSPPSQSRRPPAPNAHSFSSYRGGSIAHRFEALFESIFDCFYDPRNMLSDTHYILAIEWDYYALRVIDDVLYYHKAGDYDQLCKYLSAPSREFKQAVFDPQTLTDDLLPIIYAQNRAGVVQFYYHVNDKVAHVYVVDERGSLFVHQHEFYDGTTLVTHYDKFFQTVLQRMQFLHQEGDADQNTIEVEFNRLERDIMGQWQCKRQARNSLFKPQEYVSLQVIGDRQEGETVFWIYCEDREYSTLEHGAELFRHVADDIFAQRRSKERYPIYITDIDLSKLLLGDNENEVQTVHFLNYKKSIEARLLEALE